MFCLRPPASSNPGDSGRDPAVGDVAQDRAAARLTQGVAVRGGDDRLADVDVVERLDRRVERDVARATGRHEQHLVLVALQGLLQHLRRRRAGVAADRVAAAQGATRGRGQVVVALLDGDRVQVGGAVVGLRVPVRVADDLDQLARLNGRSPCPSRDRS